jgi:hypothetical protein
MSNALELMLEALKRLRDRDNWRVSPREKEELGDAWVSAEEQGLKAIAAGEAELKREPVAEVCDCEGTTDDDGRPLHYALLYLPHPLPPETKLYLREETK